MKRLIKGIARISSQLVEKVCFSELLSMQIIKSVLLLSLISGASLLFFLLSIVDLGKVYELLDYKPPLPSKVYDRKNRLITEYFKENRSMVTERDIPKHLIEAFVATEDNHFFSHYGLDVQAVLRAFLTNLQSGSVKQGGSTITQQLAKVILTNRKRTYTRKAKEAVMAIYLETLRPKIDILLMYFNQIYFGHGNYGIQAASRFYFKKDIKDISVGESAILASLPSAPNRFSPFKHPRRSNNRMAHVLLKMIDMGYIRKKEAIFEYQQMQEYYAGLNAAPSATAFGQRIDKAPYFSETIRRMLEKELGSELLYTGGLSIYTTLDIDHQKEAQQTLWKRLKRQNVVSSRYIFNRQLDMAKLYSDELSMIQLFFDLPQFSIKRSFDQYALQMHYYEHLADNIELLSLAMGGEISIDRFISSVRDRNPFLNRYQSVQGAIVEIDHKTGGVIAMVGGAPFNSQNQINRTIQVKRQPGSAFKPLIYAAAMEVKAITPATIFPDSPIIFLDPNGETWMPENYSGGYRGFISVRQALAYSTNLVSIGVAREAKLSNIFPTIAKQLHVDIKRIPYNLSVALGTYEVSPLQMANAFAIYPRGGQDLDTFMIHRVIDGEGNVIRDYDSLRKPNTRQVFSLGTATLMTSLLEGVVNAGTGGRARYGGYAAGKTGTTQNFKDAWFVGFNERYTTAVWLGYDRPSLSLGPGQAGGGIAAPTWGEFQKRVLKYRKNEEPYLKKGNVQTVTICKISGKLPGHNCHEIATDIFSIDNLPHEICEEEHSIHVPDAQSQQNSVNSKINVDDFISDEDI